MAVVGFLSAVYTIAHRHHLMRLRHPLTSLLELVYPCLAVLLLLTIRESQSEQHVTVALSVLRSPTEQQSVALLKHGMCYVKLYDPKSQLDHIPHPDTIWPIDQPPLPKRWNFASELLLILDTLKSYVVAGKSSFSKPAKSSKASRGLADSGSEYHEQEYGAWALIWVAVFLLPNLRFTQVVMEEKEFKVREFIQIYGASDFAYWCGHYAAHLVYASTQAAVITFLCWFYLPEPIDVVALLFLLILYVLASISLVILVTSIMHSTRVALFVYTALHLVLLVPFILIAARNDVNDDNSYAILLAPPSALACGLDNFVGGFQATSVVRVLSQNYLSQTMGLNCGANPFAVFGFLALDTLLYLAVGWYIYQINPGEYGVPKNWTFIFQKSYWSAYGKEWQPRRKAWATPKTYHPYDMVSDLFERNYKDGLVEPLVVVDEVHKIFPITRRWSAKRAINWVCIKLDIGVQKPPLGLHSLCGVSFTVYPSELFCVMGRNGCGKTTLMSILSGFRDATSGNVTLNGFDVHRSVGESRKCVGFSPESTFFLDSMTVGEQYRFASSLKNIPSDVAACDIEVTLKMLDIYDKADWLPWRLSEGEKKRVSIGMAFIGNPKVILIDDLSTGLDVISKRIVWRALQEMKKNRAIIVTTHDPLEASMIADRIGVLEDGFLKANGSPVFLKSRFETGYTLRLVDTGEYTDTSSQVNDLVMMRCQNAQSINDLGVELLYKIPFGDASNLRTLLRELETNAVHMGIRDISIGTTNLSEVLERACEDNTAEAERRKARQAEMHSQMAWTSYLARTTREVDLGRASGGVMSKMGRRISEPPIRCETERSAKSTESSHWSSLACTAETAQWSQDGYVLREPGYIGNPTVFSEARLKWRLALTVWNKFVRNVVAMFWKRLHTTRKDGWLLWYQILFPGAFVTFFSLMLKRAYAVDEDLMTIPLRDYEAGTQMLHNHHPRPSDGWNRVMMCCWIIIGCELIPSVWANYVTHERSTGSKMHQHAAGIPLKLYWFGELLWDAAVFLISGCIVCLAQVLVIPEPFMRSDTWPLFVLALVLFAFSAASGAFFLSFCFQSGTTIQAVMIAGVIPGLVGAYHAVNPNAYEKWTTFVFLLVPHAAFAQVAYTIAFECHPKLAKGPWICPRLLTVEFSLIPILYMVCEIFLYLIIVVFIDGLHHDPHLKSWVHKMRCIKLPRLQQPKFGKARLPRTVQLTARRTSQESRIPESEVSSHDHRRGSFGVRTEKQRAKDVVSIMTSSDFKLPTVQRKHSRRHTLEDIWDKNILVADNITKWDLSRSNKVYYLPKLTCRFKARRALIQQATFTVRSESVMGFVGLNGSGMSSMLNLLAGKAFPTHGRIWIEGVDLSVHPYHRWGKVGFCSQVDSSLESKMTGREILEMFGRINMIDRNYLRRHVIPEALQLVGLKDMKNMSIEKYSQGDKRKLSFILSLMTGPKVLLLDSPSLGVDVLSRRRIWSVIAKAKRALGRAVVLASPHPEECEVLCDRIAALQKGRIQAVGEIKFVKQRMVNGLEVLVNVCAFEQFADPAGGQLNNQLTSGNDRTKSNAMLVPLSRSCSDTLLRHFSDPHAAVPVRSFSGASMSAGGESISSPGGPRSIQGLLRGREGCGMTIVLDRAEQIVKRLVIDLAQSFPGSELIEMFDTQARIIVPVPRDESEDSEDTDDEEREAKLGPTDDSLSSPRGMYHSTRAEMSQDSLFTGGLSLEVRSLRDEEFPLPFTAEQHKAAVAGVRFWSPNNSRKTSTSANSGAPAVSETTLDKSVSSEDCRLRGGSVEAVFHWFELRRHLYHLLELTVGTVSLESIFLLLKKRESNSESSSSS